jgi:hypothetical protein
MIASELFKEKTPGLYFARIIHYSLTTRAVLPPGRRLAVNLFGRGKPPDVFKGAQVLWTDSGRGEFFLVKVAVFVGVLEQPSNHILMICLQVFFAPRLDGATGCEVLLNLPPRNNRIPFSGVRRLSKSLSRFFNAVDTQSPPAPPSVRFVYI